MKYRFAWIYRGDYVASLKKKISLRVSWDGISSGWIIEDIPLKPENTLEKRKAYIESIVSRAFDVGSRAIKDDISNRISMLRDAPPAGSP